MTILWAAPTIIEPAEFDIPDSYLRRLTAADPRVPVRLADGIGHVEFYGDWVSVAVLHHGRTVEIIVRPVASFYCCLAQMIEETLPGSAGIDLH